MTSNYGKAALAEEVAVVQSAQNGNRRHLLNTAAFKLGQLVGGGEIDRPDAMNALLEGAQSAGLPTKEALSTIKAGIDDGEKQPRKSEPRQGGGGPLSSPSNNTATLQHPPGCSLGEYAEAKKLDLQHLAQWGVTQISLHNRPALRMSYRDASGEERAVRHRVLLNKLKDEDGRFKWRKGSKVLLYGLWRLPESDDVWLVEGESCCHTLWQAGIGAVGVAGASNFKDERDAEYLERFERIFVVVEPDAGGDTLLARLSASRLASKVYAVELGDHKDVSDLYLADTEAFATSLERFKEKAVSVEVIVKERLDADRKQAWEQCAELAQEPNIIEVFDRDVSNRLVGDRAAARLLMLAVTSRLLDKLASVAVKGPSSAGKSYEVDCTLDYFPEDAFYKLTSMSDRALAFSDEPLSHRFLVLYEEAGLNSDFQSMLLRTLISEGCIRYDVTEKDADGSFKSRAIVKPGPTGLILTTCKTRIHPENETRLLSVTISDSAEQTKSILRALADEESKDKPSRVEEFKALQTWLATGPSKVTIPFAQAVAEKVPAKAVRLRRDFGAFLTLVRSHALLHQANRDRRPSDGAVIATLEDYSAVRSMVADLIAEGVDATVSESVKETVHAVAEIISERAPDSSKEVSVTELAARLGIEMSSASRRVKTAKDGGFLVNREDKRGQPARLVLGEPLPKETSILPEPADIDPLQADRCSVAVQHKGIDTPSPPKAPERSLLADFEPFPEGGPCEVCGERAILRHPSGKVMHPNCMQHATPELVTV